MKMTELTAVAAQYDALLCRYARYLTKNQRIAEALVIEVFEEYYDTSVEMNAKVLRTWFKSRVLRKCRTYNASRAFLTNTHPN